MKDKPKKQSPKKRKYKSAIKTLEDQCHDLWSLCVRERDHTCRNCNSDERLSAHHIRKRKLHTSTRYRVDNGLCLCWKCHSLEKFSPEKFHDMIIGIIGQREYNRLKDINQLDSDKYTIEELEEIKEQLTREYKRLKNE